MTSFALSMGAQSVRYLTELTLGYSEKLNKDAKIEEITEPSD